MAKRKPKIYKSYVFKGRDPIIDKTLKLIDGLSNREVHDLSDVSASTLNSWRKKKTRRPYHSTVAAIGGGVGMALVWQSKK